MNIFLGVSKWKCNLLTDIECTKSPLLTSYFETSPNISKLYMLQGRNVEICINGTLPSSGLRLPFGGLKNSAHGKVIFC